MKLCRWLGVALVLLAPACSSDDDDGCPDGQVKRAVCVQCGEAGGCGKRSEMCAQTCTQSPDCPDPLGCHDGVCQATRCI